LDDAGTTRVVVGLIPSDCWENDIGLKKNGVGSLDAPTLECALGVFAVVVGAHDNGHELPTVRAEFIEVCLNAATVSRRILRYIPGEALDSIFPTIEPVGVSHWDRKRDGGCITPLDSFFAANADQMALPFGTYTTQSAC
jgi:hypothetical protein